MERTLMTNLSFGSYIREKRMNLRKTLKDVSTALGYTSAMYISDVENEKRSPFSEEKIKILAKYLKEDAESLILLARMSKKNLELEIKGANDEKQTLALNLARRWDNLDQEVIEQLNDILNGGI
jgi:transcriptional regulator with XRE-family HTH domain